MKRILILITACIVFLVGCTNATVKNSNSSTQTDATTGYASTDSLTDNGDVIEIKEKMFIAQTNEIYLNDKDYLGKTIKYEGIFQTIKNKTTGTSYHCVFRYGPGCCGDDGNVGFEVTWDGDYPDDNDWVEAVGVLEKYEENGYEYLCIRLLSLNVLSTRGMETVSQ